jgi:hypothetical protein
VSTSIEKEVARLQGGGFRTRSPFAALADVPMRVATEASALTWPSPKYRQDPVEFARGVLGVEPWSKQIEVLEAVRDCPRVIYLDKDPLGGRPKAFGIKHPILTTLPLKITSVVVEDVTQMEQDEDGAWRCTIKFLEYRAPKPALGKPRCDSGGSEGTTHGAGCGRPRDQGEARDAASPHREALSSVTIANLGANGEHLSHEADRADRRNSGSERLFKERCRGRREAANPSRNL